MNYSEFFIAVGPSVGCKTNEECAGTEACINSRCVNPCNCGTNAECRVRQHFPSCFCRPGYSGNPQLGCIEGKFNKITVINKHKHVKILSEC